MFGSYKAAIDIVKKIEKEQDDMVIFFRKKGMPSMTHRYECFAQMASVCAAVLESEWKKEEAEFSAWYQRNYEGVSCPPDEMPFDVHAEFERSKIN